MYLVPRVGRTFDANKIYRAQQRYKYILFYGTHRKIYNKYLIHVEL